MDGTDDPTDGGDSTSTADPTDGSDPAETVDRSTADVRADASAERPANRSPFSEGFAATIAGLLALLFAVFAGMSVPAALSGPREAVLAPVLLAAASLLAFRYRRRAAERAGD